METSQVIKKIENLIWLGKITALIELSRTIPDSEIEEVLLDSRGGLIDAISSTSIKYLDSAEVATDLAKEIVQIKTIYAPALRELNHLYKNEIAKE